MSLELSKFTDVIAAFNRGEMVVMIDAADRENEGDLVIASEKVTPEVIAFMMRFGRGLICAVVPPSIAEKLNLPLQVLNNNSRYQTPFAISVDHRDVAASGVTASSRAYTISRLVAPDTTADEFVSPGHVFPLVANPAGVMARQGQTEGTHDLSRIAGFFPSGVLCEILNPDGTMARGNDLAIFVKEHNLTLTSVQEVIRHRVNNEVVVRKETAAKVDTDFGEFVVHVFADDVSGKEHLALVKGDLTRIPSSYAPLVRIHSECLTGDVFGSRRCDCGAQLAQSMQLIAKEGSGIAIYLRQEGRGIGLVNKLKAYALQDTGLDTVEANEHLGFQPDERDFAVAAQILNSLGIPRIRLLTNNPKKFDALTDSGIEITERLPVIVNTDEYSENYLKTKRDKLGHWL